MKNALNISLTHMQSNIGNSKHAVELKFEDLISNKRILN